MSFSSVRRKINDRLLEDRVFVPHYTANTTVNLWVPGAKDEPVSPVLSSLFEVRVRVLCLILSCSTCVSVSLYQKFNNSEVFSIRTRGDVPMGHLLSPEVLLFLLLFFSRKGLKA